MCVLSLPQESLFPLFGVSAVTAKKTLLSMCTELTNTLLGGLRERAQQLGVDITQSFEVQSVCDLPLSTMHDMCVGLSRSSARHCVRCRKRPRNGQRWLIPSIKSTLL